MPCVSPCFCWSVPYLFSPYLLTSPYHIVYHIVRAVSMMDAELFDKLEKVARAVRKNKMAFGGIQLVFAGDFLQLPPVRTKTSYCFTSMNWDLTFHEVVELKQVFRQADPRFVSVLNAVRIGKCDQVMSIIKECMDRKFDASDGIMPTKLHTHKRAVQGENDRQLSRLSGVQRKFIALDSGERHKLEPLKRSAPCADELHLKVGAQVMLLKNLDPTQGLANGSRGVITRFVEPSEDVSDHICPNGLVPVVEFACGVTREIVPAVWSVDEGRRKEVAKRIQIPLLLAWAITCHKAQGMTLDRAELSLSSCFEPGQAYVALSRVRSLEGLRITSFDKRVIRADPIALAFYRDLHADPKTKNASQSAPQDDCKKAPNNTAPRSKIHSFFKNSASNSTNSQSTSSSSVRKRVVKHTTAANVAKFFAARTGK
jgi:ATP-dependent DNA helicase PIF1